MAALASDVSRYEFAADEGRATIRIRLLFRRAFLTLMDQKDWDVPDILMEEWQGNVD